MSQETFKSRKLNGYDSIISSEEERKERTGISIKNIPINLIDDFYNHPFQVLDNSDMEKLKESIKENGVLTPVMVRRKENGRYEMISGHRRKHACELLGIKEIKAEIIDASYDEAVIIMADSNIHRTDIKPSEKAFMYKMKIDAMKHQGKRNDLTMDPMGPKTWSSEKLASEGKDSATQIKRYVRLTFLIPEFLALVDGIEDKKGKVIKKMGMRQAIELSFIDKHNQRKIYDEFSAEECIPSHDQALRLRKAFEEHRLDEDLISDIVFEIKPNQKEKITFRLDEIEDYLPADIVRVSEQKEYIFKALALYNKCRDINDNELQLED